MLSVIIKLSVFLLVIGLACSRDGYFFLELLCSQKCTLGQEEKMCWQSEFISHKIHVYILWANIFKIVQFGQILVKMHDVTVMGHIQLPNFTCLGPTLLISHRNIFQLRLSLEINFWHFPFSCHSNSLG